MRHPALAAASWHDTFTDADCRISDTIRSVKRVLINSTTKYFNHPKENVNNAPMRVSHVATRANRSSVRGAITRSRIRTRDVDEKPIQYFNSRRNTLIDWNFK